MAVASQLGLRQNHSHSSHAANAQQAQLANAYQNLARELASDQIKVVGGYTLGKVIGEGTFGSVHIASHRVTGTRCAIKKVPKSATPQLTREIHHHRRLHHPHIVHLHETIATESHIWLVSELCSGGELFDYLVERGRLLEGEARRLFGELCTAVGYLHRQGVVHRDLKLENVLLDGEMRVKLGDLGFAREYQRGRLLDTYCGTTGYASPEMLACKKYLGVETDIWSLGIILYTLLCGGLPFDDDDERVMKDLIQKGEYEEPEWLSEQAHSLIRSMLQHEPADRPTMEEILTHPWFKKTLYDSVTGATSTDDPRSLASVPASPMAMQTSFSDTSRSGMPSPASSFPFSPRTSRQRSQIIEPPAPNADMDSVQSETSFDFSDTVPGKPTSGDTSPTTAETEEDAVPAEYPQLNEKTLELLHRNSSQSTIRHAPEGSSTSNLSLRSRLAKNSSVEFVDDEDQITPRENKRLSTSSLPMIDERSSSHTHLPLAEHSRTPLRTKRRSLTSQLTMERRHSHQSMSSQWQAFPAEDYLEILNADRPPLFSTPSEKLLLSRLSDLGFDTGQLMHSVRSDACDTSAAMWWILRLKQLERGETDDLVQSRQEKRKERRRRRKDDKATPNVTLAEPSLYTGSGPPSRRRSHEENFLASSTASSFNPPEPIQLHPPSNCASPTSPSTPQDQSPLKERKSRQSMNMLQRATSVFVGGKHGVSKNGHADKTDRLTPEADPKAARAESPTKRALLGHGVPAIPILPTKISKSDSDPTLAAVDLPPKTPPQAVSPARSIPEQQQQLQQGQQGPQPPKGPKKDSLWTTFRHLFIEDKRRRKGREENTDTAPPPVRPPPVIPSRGLSARGMSRTSLPGSSRRTSIDGRAMYSHRSSGVNSRRSSVTSMNQDFTINKFDGLNLNRRASERSTKSALSARSGASTPSERLSRASSIRSRRSRRPRTPGGSFRPPPSPLHDYHRRAASGGASTRVRHIKVLHEAKALRPSSVASSIRSNCSSYDSDDTGREDNSIRNYRKWSDEKGGSLTQLAQHPSRTRSPLAKGHTSTSSTGSVGSVGLMPSSNGLKQPKPIRDVFKSKKTGDDDDDEWESEQDEFCGGLGQSSVSTSTSNYSSNPTNKWNTKKKDIRVTTTSVRKANRHGDWGPSPPNVGIGIGIGIERAPFMDRGRNLADPKEEQKRDRSAEREKKGGKENAANANSRSRRGMPAARQAPVIEEEEEEEE